MDVRDSSTSSQLKRSRGGGFQRVLTKLQNSLDKANYYEAHQLYRTLYFRYIAQGRYEDCATDMYEGALKLFSHSQFGSGVDLAKLYLEVLLKAKASLEEKNFIRVSNLYKNIPIDSPDKNVFLSMAIRWSSADGFPNGHHRLHQLFAHSLWGIKRYPESRHHFLYSTDGSGCGTMLAEFHFSRGFPKEVDLFVVGTILQFLCLRKHIVAAFTLQTYTEKHPSIKKGPPYSHPLLNFVWLLLLAIETKQSLSAFSILIEKYKPSLDRDPSYLEYLDKIGQTFFGVPPPQRPTGMFSGLFDSLFGALNEGNEVVGEASGATSARVNCSPRKMETEDLD